VKLYLDQRAEAQNILVCGATGTRKSSILRSFADQAIARGWPVIFTDLKREYVAEYYRPGVDYLINFADARCAKWVLHREFTSQLEARTVAHAIIKEREHSIPYFIDGVRNILSFLLGDLHLSVPKILDIIKDPGVLEKVLQGSGLEVLMKGSLEARYGFVGNLNNALAPLGLLPQDDGRQEFCVREWSRAGKNRKGNIFLASSPDDFPAQKEMQTLMLDMLLLGMQTTKGPGLCLFDEIGVWGEIPRYEQSLSIQRSSGNPIVSAFQGFSQLRENYGIEKAESITSNPYTTIVLRMKSPKEAEYAADLLAKPAELERVKESIDANQLKDYSKKHHSYSSERPMVSPVTAGQVQALPDGHGFLGQAGSITPLHIAYRPAKRNQPDLVPRVWPAWVPPEKPKEKKNSDLQKRPHLQDYTQAELPT
jgi:hypothetical protein